MQEYISYDAPWFDPDYGLDHPDFPWDPRVAN